MSFVHTWANVPVIRAMVGPVLERALALAEGGSHALACHLVDFAAAAEPDSARLHVARARIYEARARISGAFRRDDSAPAHYQTFVEWSPRFYAVAASPAPTDRGASRSQS